MIFVVFNTFIAINWRHMTTNLPLDRGYICKNVFAVDVKYFILHVTAL